MRAKQYLCVNTSRILGKIIDWSISFKDWWPSALSWADPEGGGRESEPLPPTEISQKYRVS